MRIWTLCILVIAFLGCAGQPPATETTKTTPATPKQTASAQTGDPNVEKPKTDAVETAKQEPVVAKKVQIEKLTSANLPNPIRVGDKVISGGVPEGDDAFAELKALGVKTVISVDGAKPDVETARKHGLRYVHLPHGYDGIPESRVKELAKAVHDLEGPIYIHCHHGKHRSPAAASTACVVAGLIPPEEADDVLKLAGTSANYKGLYQSAEQAKPLSNEELDEVQVEFQESADVPPLAEAMVNLEHTFDLVKKLNENKWKPLAKTPDVNAAHEVLLLQEHFTEMQRLDETKNQPADLVDLLEDSERAALALQAGVEKLNQGEDKEAIEQLAKAVTRIEANCKKCHEQYRNVPLGEK